MNSQGPYTHPLGTFSSCSCVTVLHSSGCTVQVPHRRSRHSRDLVRKGQHTRDVHGRDAHGQARLRKLHMDLDKDLDRDLHSKFLHRHTFWSSKLPQSRQLLRDR